MPRIPYYLLIAVVAVAAFCGGYYAGAHHTPSAEAFHDMLVNHPHNLKHLVEPRDKHVRVLAADLKTPENAYLFVRDRIADNPSLAVSSPEEIVTGGQASCLGKAVLLCSLYRAIGIPAKSVRVVVGEASIPSGVFDHAWVELEQNGIEYQQDSTHILGTFAFGQFQGDAYATAYIRDEEVVFNDINFASVSQLNLMKSLRHPAVH
jgi:hypothetical protein